MGAPETRYPVKLDRRLESTLESVDRAEEIVVGLAPELGLEEEAAYQLGYAVREAMVNAVVHGNRYSANRMVHLVVGGTESGVEVLIEDEGEGFDCAAMGDPLADENLLNQSGRGITLIRAFVDEFFVERMAPLGTRVILRKAIGRSSGPPGAP
jgi:serine/threonine-protein kinase RsbW